jgi:hypothetical protein
MRTIDRWNGLTVENSDLESKMDKFSGFAPEGLNEGSLAVYCQERQEIQPVSAAADMIG